MKQKSAIKKKFSSLSIRKRMLFLYLLGGFIPFIIVLLIINNNAARTQAEQQIANETEKLRIEADMIVNSMNTATELSEKMKYDLEEEKVVISQYYNGRNLYVDYHNYSELDEYIQNCYKEVMNVTVYLYPEMLGEKKVIDNRHFRLITGTIKRKEWYLRTIMASGNPSWSYITQIRNSKKTLRMSRLLYSMEGRNVGIVSITLNESVAGDYIAEQPSQTFLIHNNKTVVFSNAESNNRRIIELINKSDINDNKIYIDGKDYTCAVASIKPRYSDDTYLLIGLASYDAIITSGRKRILTSFIPVLLCLLFMTLSITMLINGFSHRMNSLVRAMRRVTYGNYNVDDTDIERYQDEIYEVYTVLKKLVEDTRNLSEMAANERIQKERIYSRQKDVEFKMLATQINPHFLYNTLENIRMMASINGEKDIADMSFNLTKLLRKTLSAGQGLKPLLWEMEMVESYIKIQNYRFDDRIRAIIEYDKSDAERYSIIPFVVQPFVENAYVHAMESMESGGRIIVRAETDDELKLYVEDNGCGMSEEKLAEVTRQLNDFENIDRNHIGVVNVNQRIKLAFGDKYGVDFQSSENNGTRVVIRMPLIEK